MDFNRQAGPSRSFHPVSFPAYGDPSSTMDQDAPREEFDVLEWYPHFQSCQRYFLDHAQHSAGVQTLAAFINIQLPFQKAHPVISSASAHAAAPSANELAAHLRHPHPFSHNQAPNRSQSLSLIPYIRRLVATGHDSKGVLHGFFGDAWVQGIGQLHEVERRNYLFAAKSTTWMEVKQAYDMGPEETIPFLNPLRETTEEEMQNADARWGDWLAMQDWMLGPRAPGMIRSSLETETELGGTRVKREPRA
ncbi:hypothetical protein B7494_g373 [Chlorociboria aeruginascens]|nr:hypothetical protein B7494_g373 [Chlorociboria aeruginascens]